MEKKSLIWHKFQNNAVAIGRKLVELGLTLWFCMTDKKTPVRIRLVILVALGYFLSPIDIIPDFIPGVGYLDDMGVLVWTALLVASHITPKHRSKANETTNQWFGVSGRN